MNQQTTETLIVGAGPAGLAVGGCLRQSGLSFVILEKGDAVGPAWRRHYDRLHLHTDKAHSTLPGLRFPRGCPRYPSRAQVVEYLEEYAREFDLRPRFGQEVRRVCWQEGAWHAETADTRYRCRNLVIATGYNRRPNIPRWPGDDLFRGDVLHSSEYRSGRPFRGKRALVIGFGNSGAEIAIDLCEHGARPTVSVRSPVNVIPRDVLGLPVLAVSIPLAKLPSRLADLLGAPIVRWVYADQERLGLSRPADGPFTDIRKRSRIPVIDVGTIELIRNGQLRVRPGVERMTERGVVFVGGTEEPFDTVVLATGYRPAVLEFLESGDGVVGAGGTPRVSGGTPAAPGLYFCGFYVSPTGMLRDIATEAREIADDIGRSASGSSRASASPEADGSPSRD